MIGEFIANITNNQYLTALMYLIIWFFILRISVYILEKIILKMTVKTNTTLDDLIISKSAKPLTIIVLLISMKIALDKLPWSEGLVNTINLSMNTLIGIVSLYLVYVIFSLSFMRVVKKVSKKTNGGYNEGLIQLTKSTLQVTLILAGMIYILGAWGIEIGPILTGIGIGGIALAFALQSSLSNVFGGISIILDKSVNVGDLVILEGNVSGKILRIGLRSTKIKTFDNEVIIVPNSKLAESNIHNVAQPEPKSRVVIQFGVAYGTEIEKVKKIVFKEIKQIKGFVDDPEPNVRFIEMGNSSLNFKAYFFVDSFENRFAAIDEANTRIYNALNKAGISIPFPQMDVHLKK